MEAARSEAATEAVAEAEAGAGAAADGAAEAEAEAERFSRNQRPTRLFPCKFLQIFFCELLPSYFAVREESNWSAHARGHTPFPTERAFMADQGDVERERREGERSYHDARQTLSVRLCVRSAPTTHGHGSGCRSQIEDAGLAKEHAGRQAGGSC